MWYQLWMIMINVVLKPGPLLITPLLWRLWARRHSGFMVLGDCSSERWDPVMMSGFGTVGFQRLMKTQKTSALRTRDGNVSTCCAQSPRQVPGGGNGDTPMSSIRPLLTSWHQSQYQRSYLADSNTPLGQNGKYAVTRPLTGTPNSYPLPSCLPGTQSAPIWAGPERLPPGALWRLVVLWRTDLSLPTLLEETTKTKPAPAST